MITEQIQKTESIRAAVYDMYVLDINLGHTLGSQHIRFDVRMSSSFKKLEGFQNSRWWPSRIFFGFQPNAIQDLWRLRLFKDGEVKFQLIGSIHIGFIYMYNFYLF